MNARQTACQITQHDLTIFVSVNFPYRQKRQKHHNSVVYFTNDCNSVLIQAYCQRWQGLKRIVKLTRLKTIASISKQETNWRTGSDVIPFPVLPFGDFFCFCLLSHLNYSMNFTYIVLIYVKYFCTNKVTTWCQQEEDKYCQWKCVSTIGDSFLTATYCSGVWCACQLILWAFFKCIGLHYLFRLFV